MTTSTETKNVLKALLNLKKELMPVVKGEDNPFFKSQYADLNTHLDAVDPLAMKFGLVLTQSTGRDMMGNFVETRLTHAESGEFVASSLTLVLAKQDMQQMGSAVTYARRYTIGSLLGMKAVDDDGNMATFGNTKATTTQATTTAAPAKKASGTSSFRKPKPTEVTAAPANVDAGKTEETPGWS